MALGKFKETNESNNEIKEANESKEQLDRPRNQILDGCYDDNFEKKLDDIGKDSKSDIAEKGIESGKSSFLDKMKNLFSKKENSASKKLEDTESDVPTQSPTNRVRNEFIENLQKEYQEYRKNRPPEAKKVEQKKDVTEGSSDTGQGIEQGEDGERTRYSDAMWRLEHGHDEER